MADETVEKAPEVEKGVALLPEEKATLSGLMAAFKAVDAQVKAYMTETVCARLGIHFSRLEKFDCAEGTVTLKQEQKVE